MAFVIPLRPSVTAIKMSFAAASFDFIEYACPVCGPFIVWQPHPENFTGAVGSNGQGKIQGFGRNGIAVFYFYSQSIKKTTG